MKLNLGFRRLVKDYLTELIAAVAQRHHENPCLVVHTLQHPAPDHLGLPCYIDRNALWRSKVSIDRPRLAIDFNELISPDLVLLSQTDSKLASDGSCVKLYAGLHVFLYEDDFDDDGNMDPLFAAGIVERNTIVEGWGSCALWCCRILDPGILSKSEFPNQT